MEPVHGICKASKSASEDVISSMPDIVITNIMDRLSIKEAVRTGILSRDWRFKWTMLSQLVFDEFFNQFRFSFIGNSELNINRLLLHLKGPITKFFIRFHQPRVLDIEDLNHWLMFLSRKGIKEFTIINIHKIPLKLPSHLFSCLELKHLQLHTCCLHPPLSFRGFPNLLSLDLNSGPLDHENCGELITLIIGCPLLEILKLDRHLVEVLKLVHISKLGNLRMLSLSLSDRDNTEITGSSIFQLMDFFPKLEELNLDLYYSKLVVATGARKRLPTAFNCLKTLRLIWIAFDSGIVLSSAFELIWSFPNLQTLELTTIDSYPPLALGSAYVDYNTMGQLQHLQSVVIRCFRGSDDEVCLLKSLLASSPMLKKIILYADICFESDEELIVAKKLLKFHRASSTAEVDLC